MALTKVIYTDDETIIEAQNMNDIQDEIIKCVNTDEQTLTSAQKAQARTNIGLDYTVVSTF